MATRTTQRRRQKDPAKDQSALLEILKDQFDTRLARLASGPAEWIEFLDRAAVFGAHYTLRNQLLLLAQADERGLAPRYFLPYGNKAGTSGWKAQRRHVRPGEHAFTIWAPIRRRPTEEQAERMEAEGRTVRREASGRPAVQVVGFRPSPTFELSQTDGEPFEPPTTLVRRRVRRYGGTLPQLLEGDDPTGVYEDLVGLIRGAGYTFELVAPGTGYLDTANGVTIRRAGLRLVQVRDDVDPAQRTKTTAHELAHDRCGHLDDPGFGEHPHRGRRETEAESVTHIVLGALGLDTSSYSDAYVLGWAEGDLQLIQDCAENVLRVARQILLDLTPHPHPHPDPDLVDAETADRVGDTATGSASASGDPAWPGLTAGAAARGGEPKIS